MLAAIRKRLLAITGVAAAWLATVAPPALAKPPLDAFGDAASVRSVTMSPDGSKMAYLSRVQGVDYLALYDVATGRNEPLIRASDVNARGAYFLSNDYIILTASRTTDNVGATRKYVESASFAYSLKTRKIVQLGVNVPNLWPYQAGTSGIVGRDADEKYVYMSLFIDHPGSEPSLDLVRINLDTGRGAAPTKRGNSATTGWYLDVHGRVVAREDFWEQKRLHEIISYDADGGTRIIYSEQTEIPSLSLAGFSEVDGKLIAVDRRASNFYQIFEMSLADGKLAGPLHVRGNADIEGVLRDRNKIVAGLTYAGILPSYDMFDPALDKDLEAATRALPDAAVNLVSWTDDWSKLLLYADGGSQPGRYMLFDRNAKSMRQLARSRPDIAPSDVGEVVPIEYAARDGLKISALMTWPVGVPVAERRNLPLVVMPHGGPESYDSLGFDWLAQFLANEGYAVLQPNFRGSGGYGQAFAEAGYKQWGRKMQDDVTDGVAALKKMGWADPSRICIVGWSYGGYAALVGGAMTPDLYKCVVSIAGVSDLRSMMGFEISSRGVNSSAYAYWKHVIGDPNIPADNIDAVSPARLADSFKAPVLLIHGTDDTTVQSRQSDTMEGALKRAGKPVTYIRIKGDDHSLVDIESRRTVLASVSQFLATYLAKPAGQ